MQDWKKFNRKLKAIKDYAEAGVDAIHNDKSEAERHFLKNEIASVFNAIGYAVYCIDECGVIINDSEPR